jgi:hypothetical protein
MAKRAAPKIYPEEVFFVVPGKNIPLPVWKQQELASDPSFRDLGEQVKDLEAQGSRGVWSAKHGYETTFREEAAVLKANGREAKAKEKKAIEAIQKTRLPSDEVDSCCTIC